MADPRRGSRRLPGRARSWRLRGPLERARRSLPGTGRWHRSLTRCCPPCASVSMAAMATTRRADMFTADGKPSDDDPRENGPSLGDERATLAENLRCWRLTLEMKCEGL